MYHNFDVINSFTAKVNTRLTYSKTIKKIDLFWEDRPKNNLLKIIFPKKNYGQNYRYVENLIV